MTCVKQTSPAPHRSVHAGELGSLDAHRFPAGGHTIPSSTPPSDAPEPSCSAESQPVPWRRRTATKLAIHMTGRVVFLIAASRLALRDHLPGDDGEVHAGNVTSSPPPALPLFALAGAQVDRCLAREGGYVPWARSELVYLPLYQIVVRVDIQRNSGRTHARREGDCVLCT